jgi:hypothetical protein
MDDMSSITRSSTSSSPVGKDDGQQRSDDDLTHIYMNIIKYNNILTEKVSNPDLLQDHRGLDGYPTTFYRHGRE